MTRLADEIDRDVLRLREAVEHRGEGEFAAEPALLVPAVGMAGHLTATLIDLYPSGLDVPRGTQGLADIMRPEAREIAGRGKVKIGVLTDLSSLYSDATGAGSISAVQLGVEDYKKANPNSKLQIEIISADHQNKPDVGSSIARQWYERDGVDLIIDVPNSALALAVVDIIVSAGSTRLTGDLCNANTVQWTFDNYSLAHGTGSAMVAGGGKSWFFITTDYSFGIDLEKQTSDVVKADGGTVLGSVRAPLDSPDFSSFLLQAQASKAQVIGLANAGGDMQNAIKGASEFGIVKGGQKMAALAVFITDLHSLGLPVAQGLNYTTAFYWDMNDLTREWTRRFILKAGTDRLYPTMDHAGNYSGTIHFLKAIEAAQTHDGAKIVATMKELPTDDVVFGKGQVRADGRKIHPMHLMQVKTPAESKGPWDLSKLIKTIPIDQAFRPLAQSDCPLLK